MRTAGIVVARPTREATLAIFHTLAIVAHTTATTNATSGTVKRRTPAPVATPLPPLKR